MYKSPRVLVNGFGRIGRVLTRITNESDAYYEIVAINDPAIPLETAAYLLRHDSTYGSLEDFGNESRVKCDGKGQKIGPYKSSGRIIFDDKPIEYFSLSEGKERPAKLPLKELGIDIVLESSGLFTDSDKAGLHLNSGAKKVVISAPAKGDLSKVYTVVMGVNDKDLDLGKCDIISNASCTTNAWAPLVFVLNETEEILYGDMLTVHAYTGDQALLDRAHKKITRGRSAADNIVPTTTGAATAIDLIFPELEGKFTAKAMRVPVRTGSVIYFNVVLDGIVTPDDLKETFKEYSQMSSPLHGYLGISEDELVSSDVIGSDKSSVVSLPQIETRPLISKSNHKTSARIIAYYDNEWGYASRLRDLLNKVAEELL